MQNCPGCSETPRQLYVDASIFLPVPPKGQCTKSSKSKAAAEKQEKKKKKNIPPRDALGKL